MGLMLETTSTTLLAPGAAHDNAPDKVPAKRLRAIEDAGKQKVPFTTGILIGIGETLEDRVDTLLAIRELHERYGHIQEVIVQNFRAKPGIRRWLHGRNRLARNVARRWLSLASDAPMNIQAPPNLSDPHYADLLDGGINDWGGISPLTPDFINPEKPWPHLDELQRGTNAKGFELRQRLPVYPEFAGASRSPKRFAKTAPRAGSCRGSRRCNRYEPGRGMITVLTGGTGGAKFVDGLRQIVPPEELTIIVNTGDDFAGGASTSPPTWTRSPTSWQGILSQERGWGVAGDTFFCLKTMSEMKEPDWFGIGDRDLALHIFRTKLLAEGRTLSDVTNEIAARLGISSRILPMSNSRIETRVLTSAGELSFEEYFVQRRYQDPVQSVHFCGSSEAEPAPGILEAIRSSELVLLAPSNPVTSIGPILAVPGIREALRNTSALAAAVSPIVGGSAVTGPAGALLACQGFEVSIAGIADYYRDFLDLLVVDSQDAERAARLNKSIAHNARGTAPRVHCAPAIMRRNNNADRVVLAKSAIEACRQISASRAAAELA